MSITSLFIQNILILMKKRSISVSYGVPFVPLPLHTKNKLNIFGASISKCSFDFKIELRFRNGAPISKSRFDFGIELRFQNWTSISNGAFICKSSFDFEMEHRFRNGASISKSNFDFEMELRFRNKPSISKWSFDFEIELRFQNAASISKWSFDFNLKVFHVIFCTEKRDVVWVHASILRFYRGQSSSLASWPEKRREKEREMVEWNDK